MKNYRIGNYTRISKRKAMQLYKAGKTVYFVPVNINPLFPGFFPYSLNRSRAEQFAIDETGIENYFNDNLASFEYYNCTCNETGRYTAFYIMED